MKTSLRCSMGARSHVQRLDLRASGRDRVVGREDPSEWSLQDLDEAWAGPHAAAR